MTKTQYTKRSVVYFQNNSWNGQDERQTKNGSTNGKYVMFIHKFVHSIIIIPFEFKYPMKGHLCGGNARKKYFTSLAEGWLRSPRINKNAKQPLGLFSDKL